MTGCLWDSCDDSAEWFYDGYCSHECRRKAMVRAEKLFTDGVENLPPVQEIDRRFDHAQRWTPGEMQERIDELERRMRVAQPVVWDVDD